MPNRNLRFNNLIDPDSGRMIAIDDIVTDGQLETATNQQWSPTVSYTAGTEVVHNGRRYTAKLNSGPTYGQPQEPDPSIVEYWFEIPSAGTRDFEFLSVPVGMELAFDTPPPINDPRFRFVKLTADDAYNNGVLNNKVISGTAPNLVVKMTVNYALSPINGQQIFMLNTMESTRRPGVNGENIVLDASRKITAAAQIGYNHRETFSSLSGAFIQDTSGNYATNTSASLTGPTRLVFDSSLVVPTAPRNEVFAVTEVRYKRIY